MSVIDKLLIEWAFRCKKGYPDMKNPEDMKILQELYKEYGIVIEDKKVMKEEEKEQEVVEYSAKDLIKLLQDRESELDSNFIQKIYHTVETKGKKLGQSIVNKLKEKELQASTNEIFSIIQQYSGLEKKISDFLQHSENQLTIAQLQAGTNIVNTIQQATDLPEEFITAMLKAGRSSEGGKGVGEGEALLAFAGKGGKKLKIGDVQIEGKEIEVKAQGGRLIGRAESLQDLYSKLEKLGVSPRKLGRGSEALHTYIPQIIAADSTLEPQIKDLLTKEFGNFSGVDLTSSQKIYEALLEWYVDYFLNNEAKTADYIFILIGQDYAIYTKQEFKQAVLNGDVLFGNLSATNKSPQLSSFN